MPKTNHTDSREEQNIDELVQRLAITQIIAPRQNKRDFLRDALFITKELKLNITARDFGRAVNKARGLQDDGKIRA